MIKSVSLRLTDSDEYDNYFAYDFLNNAVALESLTISRSFSLDPSIDRLLDFISAHTTLKTVGLLDGLHYCHTTSGFLVLYEKILTAVAKNDSILDLRIRFRVQLTPTTMPAFMSEVSRISAILEGRRISISGVPIEKIIRDFVNPFPFELTPLEYESMSIGESE